MAPSDISALSPVGQLSPAPSGAMDEPLAPQMPEEAKPGDIPKPAAIPNTGAAAAPAAPVAKAPAPSQSAPSPAAKAPAAAPAPAAAKPPAAAPTAAAASPAPSASPPVAAYSLPSAPTSSTRSVEAAPAPVAEIRVDAVRGERFELRFNGSGWTYLGDEESKDGIRYETRRFEGNEAIFALRPEKGDDYLLRFQRQDPVSGERQSSLVRVSVREPGAKLPAASASLSAPAAAQASAPVSAAAALAPAAGATPSASGSPAVAAATAAPAATVAPSAAAAPSAASIPAAEGNGAAGSAATDAGSAQAAAPSSPSQANQALLALSEPSALLSYARSELDAKRARAALDALDRYIELFKRGSDEVFYLYGLAYEQDTPFRDIKLSYANYKRVRDEYPRSARWKAAAERVAYMERHYYGLK